MIKRWCKLLLIILLVAGGIFLCYKITHPDSSYEAIPRELREPMVRCWPTDRFGQRFLDGENTFYYGTHGDCVAFIFVDNTWPHKHHKIEAAGYSFSHSSYFEIIVYHDGEYVQLEEAYQRGWLKKRHIRSIAFYHEHSGVLADCFGF